MTFNIFACDGCKRRILAEEVDTHVCKTMKEYKIIDSTLWVSDGEKWYPLKLTTNRKFTGQRNNRKFTGQRNNRKFTGQRNNRKFDRALKQYPYKVLVPYYTVWLKI